jgi:dihydroorotate dehydrogenase
MLKGLALSSGKRDLILDPPIMNSAGILGFAPDPKLPFDFTVLGAFITHPLSAKHRSPAHPTFQRAFPGGVLLHTGLPNPGLRAALRNYKKLWDAHSKPMIAHILGDNLGELESMVEALESIQHPIQALEIGLEDTSPKDATVILTTLQMSQLPLLTRVPPSTDRDVIHAAIEVGVNAIVMGPPRGSIKDDTNRTISGRYYGLGILPIALQRLELWVKWFEIPIILGCGLFSAEDVRLAFALGAMGVQLDTALWLEPDRLFQDLQPLLAPEEDQTLVG